MGENAFIDAVARCTECHAEGAIFDDEDAHSIEKNRADATGAWNRRALSVPVNGQGSGSLRPSDCVPGGDEAKTAGQPRGAAK
jgi:hypothetical protein